MNDLTGQRFGRLVAVNREGAKWRCRCDCGEERLVMTGYLRNGATSQCRTCGRNGQRDGRVTHGQRGRHGEQPTRTYAAWAQMKRRCTKTNAASAERYVLRGIGYDPRWERFANFLADMGECPEGLTIDRIDNDKGYSKVNCRWTGYTEQCRNRSNTRWFEHDGETKVIAEWAEELGVTYNAMRRRIDRHGSVYPVGQF